MAYRGRYTPIHPEKYVGDVNNVIWRSTWERRLFRYCDSTPGVLRWASEELVIPYISPLDGCPHRYFPDVWMEVQSGAGKRVFLIEVKPKSQSVMPTRTRRTRKFLQEAATFAVNQAKWAAAEQFCKQRGWTFRVLTEDELFAKRQSSDSRVTK